ncbi:MAG: flagellar biosynthetic protein FliO [Proteobacteria bacterium]|nr:flagellar biosynthetic protein FliO [Pseudomonadota bacterium]
MTEPPLRAHGIRRRPLVAALTLALGLALAGAVFVPVATAGTRLATTAAVAGDFPWNDRPDLGTRPGRTGSPASPGLGLGKPPAPAPAARDYDLLGSSIRMVGALGVVLGLIWLVLWLARRFFTQRPLISGGHVINVLASRHIAPKKQIVVVDVEGQRLVLGVAGDSITFLTRLEPGEDYGGSAVSGRRASGGDTEAGGDA